MQLLYLVFVNFYGFYFYVVSYYDIKFNFEQISELQLQLPETGMLRDLLRQAENCRKRCGEILKGPISGKVSLLVFVIFFLFSLSLSLFVVSSVHQSLRGYLFNK